LFREKSNQMTRVIIVDDNENFRKGLKAVLNNMEQAKIVGEATNGSEFLEILSQCDADLVFMDVKMPLFDGINATRAAKRTNPNIVIYAFSSYENDEYKKSMMEAGADGYLCKSHDNYELLNSIIKNPKNCDTASLLNKNK
jgi:YesN/AraC family two-component response regulator